MSIPLKPQLLHLRDFKRKLQNKFMIFLLVLAALTVLAPLGFISAHVIANGAHALNLSFFTELPKPVGEAGGGMANAVLGSATLLLLAVLAGVPLGMFGGIYLAEYGKGKLAFSLRFAIDLLTSVPSILVGLFAYAVVVIPMRRFSALAGGFALAVILIPVVARTTEELLKLVPDHIREAGLALGLPRWKVTLGVVVRGSMSGIITGVMLAVARAAGETAPLLFTAFGNQYWTRSLDQPVASIPVQIYNYSISPYDDWHQKAWAGALVLVLLVFGMNVLARLVFKRTDSGRD